MVDCLDNCSGISCGSRDTCNFTPVWFCWVRLCKFRFLIDNAERVYFGICRGIKKNADSLQVKWTTLPQDANKHRRSTTTSFFRKCRFFVCMRFISSLILDILYSHCRTARTKTIVGDKSHNAFCTSRKRTYVTNQLGFMFLLGFTARKRLGANYSLKGISILHELREPVNCSEKKTN